MGSRLAIFALMTLLASAAPASAAFPGANGEVAVMNDQECDQETVSSWRFDPDTGEVTDYFFALGDPAWSPDGNRVASSGIESGRILVTTLGGSSQEIHPDGYEPAWSPDGTRVALAFYDELAIVNADGSGYQRLLDGNFMHSPKWSPDGTRIAFSARLGGETDHEIYVVKLANGNVTKLTDNGAGDSDPDWSPDGSQLTFTSSGPTSSSSAIYRMNADGSGQSTALASGTTPAWSPDATRIIFARYPNIYSMAPDGSDEQFELDGAGLCIDEPDWQPLPDDTPSTHVRPAGATPFRVPLVPAARQCTAPNRTHGPPLAFPSCNPPRPGSPNLTVGVGDGSPAFGRSEGSLRMAVIVGTAGPPDDTDVSIRFRLTNVMNVSGLSDYGGELMARLGQRLTSRNGSGVAATTVDMPFEFVVPCAATADTTLGGLCSLETTMDALRPGLAAEAARTVFALDALRVYDGGADGDADTEGDNSLLATQGVFVP